MDFKASPTTFSPNFGQTQSSKEPIKRWLVNPKTKQANKLAFYDNHQPIKENHVKQQQQHKTIKENQLPSTLILDLGPGSDFFKKGQNNGVSSSGFDQKEKVSVFDPNTNWPSLGQKLQKKATEGPDLYNFNGYKNEQRPRGATGFNNEQRSPVTEFNDEQRVRATGFNNEQRSPPTSVFNTGYNYDQRLSVYNNEHNNNEQPRPKKSIFNDEYRNQQGQNRFVNNEQKNEQEYEHRPPITAIRNEERPPKSVFNNGYNKGTPKPQDSGFFNEYNGGQRLNNEQRPKVSVFNNEQKQQGSGYNNEQRSQGSEFNNEQRPKGSGYNNEQRPQGSGYNNEQRPPGSGYNNEQRPPATGFKRPTPSVFDNEYKRPPRTVFNSEHNKNNNEHNRPSSVLNNDYRNEQRPAPPVTPAPLHNYPPVKPAFSIFKNDYRTPILTKNDKKKKLTPKIEQRPLLAKVEERPTLPLNAKKIKPKPAIENTRWPPPGHGQHYQEPVYLPPQPQRPVQPKQVQPVQPVLFQPAPEQQPIPQNGYLASQNQQPNQPSQQGNLLKGIDYKTIRR